MNYRWIRDYNSTKNDVYVDANTSSASKRNWMSRDWVVENILDYKFQLGEKHAFDVTLMVQTEVTKKVPQQVQIN
jgi:hypothetical protein